MDLIHANYLKSLIVDSGLLEKADLTEKEKRIVVIFLQEQRAFAYIASKLKVSVNTIENDFNEAMIKLVYTFKSLLLNEQKLHNVANENKLLRAELKEFKIKLNAKEKNELQLNMHFDESILSFEKIHFSVRAKKALQELGVKNLVDLKNLSKEDLLLLDNIGKRTLNEIINQAQELGINIQ